MKKCIAAVLLCSLIFAFAPPTAFACGGPAMDDIDHPLQPAATLLAWLTIVPCNSDSTCQFIEDLPTIPELLFLNPFRLSRPKETEDLWKFSYESNGTTDDKGNYTEYQPPAALSTEDLETDLQAGEFGKAATEAQSLFDQVMNMPAPLAENNHTDFVESLEALELKPLFGKIPAEELKRYFSLVNPPYWPTFIPLADPKLPEPLKESLAVLNLPRERAEAFAKAHPSTPRLGTLRFIALQEARRTQIPDGWKEEIQKKVAPETWKSLEAAHDQWLQDFPNHPLADLVKLSKLRLYYLQGNDKKAWQTVFDVYARRPIRALAEMRFLLKQAYNPEFADVPQDPVLLAALAPWFDYKKDTNTWTTLWKLSEANASAPWSVNLQERLLLQAAYLAQKDKPLPDGFPKEPKNPSQLWGQYRLFALYKSGQYDKALEEAVSLKPNAEVAGIQAKLYMMRGDWPKVMALDKLPVDSKKYFLRVLLDDDALKTLVDVPQKDVASEARLALAIHQVAAKGDWNGGATLLDPANPAQASLWRDAAKLAADKSPEGLLAWARFLRKNDGKLFYKADTVWYRSLFSRLTAFDDQAKNPQAGAANAPTDPALPLQPDQEGKLLLAHFTSLEPYLALKAYSAWLEKAGAKDSQGAAVLKEADKTYNGLVNWANNYSDSWKSFLDKSPEAQTIRRVGTEISRH